MNESNCGENAFLKYRKYNKAMLQCRQSFSTPLKFDIFFCGFDILELYIDKHSCIVFHFIQQNLFLTLILILFHQEMSSTASPFSNAAKLAFQHQLEHENYLSLVNHNHISFMLIIKVCSKNDLEFKSLQE